MATKTFVDGATLSASDMNTYCANSSLTVIGSGTFSGATEFTVDGFTNAYYQWQLMIYLTTADANGQLKGTLKIGATEYTTSYYSCGQTLTYLGATGTDGLINNGAYMVIGRHGLNSNLMMIIDIHGMAGTANAPMFATQPFFEAQIIGQRSYAGYRSVGGVLLPYDALRVQTTSSATMTGKYVLSGRRLGDY